MKAFLTGSYVYSIPTKHSDIDLVVFMGRPELEKLIDYAERKKVWWVRLRNRIFKKDSEYDNTLSASLRFGPLNLLCVTTQRDYDVWRTGTDYLKGYAPISRTTAVLTFKGLQRELPNHSDTVEDLAFHNF